MKKIFITVPAVLCSAFLLFGCSANSTVAPTVATTEAPSATTEDTSFYYSSGTASGDMKDDKSGFTKELKQQIKDTFEGKYKKGDVIDFSAIKVNEAQTKPFTIIVSKIFIMASDEKYDAETKPTQIKITKDSEVKIEITDDGIKYSVSH